VDAWHVFCSRRAEPQMLAGDRLAGDALAAAGLQVHTFNALLLREPWEVQVDMSRWGTALLSQRYGARTL
jgi:hypothetical protein